MTLAETKERIEEQDEVNTYWYVYRVAWRLKGGNAGEDMGQMLKLFAWIKAESSVVEESRT